MNIFLKLIKSSLANCLQIKMENNELYLNTSGLHRFFQVEKKRRRFLTVSTPTALLNRGYTVLRKLRYVFFYSKFLRVFVVFFFLFIYFYQHTMLILRLWMIGTLAYGGLVGINIDKSTLHSKYFRRFRIFKFYNIWLKNVLKFFWKVKIVNVPMGFELMSKRFVVNLLNHRATLYCLYQ